MRGIRSSPSMYATFTFNPNASAMSCTFSAHPAGFRPPALVTTLIPFATHRPNTCCICNRNVPAYPASGLRSRCLCRISIVSSANQSPVSTSMGRSPPPSTISFAADKRSPKNPEQLAMRTARRGSVPALMRGRP
ncbi:unannotated protein [freshwater metagenome]|uniref:Unannotated protein n=1 Tax=freshwater metagenome TaxID=449393 RepID=A0A6J7C8M7_9ZZZZ